MFECFAYYVVYPKDGSDIHTGVDVATSIKRIKYDTIFPPMFLVDEHGFVELFRDEDGCLP